MTFAPRVRSIASLVLLALTLLCTSCDAPQARVEVALITDAIPGVEFHFVELDLFAVGGRCRSSSVRSSLSP